MDIQLIDFVVKIRMEGEGEEKCNGVGGSIHLLSEGVLSVSEQITRKGIQIEHGWKVGKQRDKKQNQRTCGILNLNRVEERQGVDSVEDGRY